MQMASGEEFVRKREFLLCVDIEGTVLDTLRLQQEQAFCPALIEVFELEADRTVMAKLWMQASVESCMRGENRFRILVHVCRMAMEKQIFVPGFDEICAWVESGSELTHGALAARVKRGAGPALARALEWSRDVNRRLNFMPKEYTPFPSAKSCLAAAHSVADIIAVGTGTAACVRAIWEKSGLAGYADAVIPVPGGNRYDALAGFFHEGYLPSHMLVIGDTLGDARLAQQAGALFFPILPGCEEVCWQRLYEEGLLKFLHGSYAGMYETKLRNAQSSFLM